MTRSGMVRLGGVALLILWSCSVDRRQVDAATPDASAGTAGAGLGGAGAGGQASGGAPAGGAPAGGSPSGGSSTGGIGTIVGGSGGTTPDAEVCQVSSQSVPMLSVKVDIVIAVDTTASMVQLLDEIETGIPVLASTLAQYHVDPKIIVLAVHWFCVPKPLGSGQCNNNADTLPYGYVHHGVAIDNYDALDQILTTYDTWKTSLRPDAVTKNLVIISDDNSAVPYQTFQTSWSKKDPPLTTGWRVSGLVTKTQCSSGGVGVEYSKLIAATGGSEVDLCVAFAQPSSDPAGFGSKLGLAFANDAGCQWQVPYPPQGSVFDPENFGVEFTTKAGVKTSVPHVSSAAKCSPLGGWWYDETTVKKKVVACPSTCDQVRQTSGAVKVTFQCP